jgi:VanZ family protein
MSTDNINHDRWRIFPWEDKLAHYILYTFLSFILLLDFNGKKNSSISKIILLLSIGIAYGGLMEIIQIFVPGRSGDVIDFLFDTAGVITGMLFYLLWKKIRY